jgi:hypothetical protein
MIERAKQLKTNLGGLVNEFNEVCSGINFFSKKIKVTEKLYISEKLPELFIIIKKYLNAIESERLLDGYMRLLRQDVKKNDCEGSLMGQSFKSIKNSKAKSYNWAYYSLFKDMVSGASAYGPAMKKSLEFSNLKPIQKAMEENNFDGELKDLKESEDAILKFNIDVLFNPKIYKKYLADFHESITAWLDAYILASEYSNTPLSKDPLTDDWKNITITFKNDYDVKLTIDGKEEASSYDKLGFADTRQDSPQKVAYVKSWKILILFAVQNGKIKLNAFAGNKSKKELFKKDRLDLSKRLKNHFGLKDDPIIYNEKNEEYQIKIKLIPSPEFRESYLDRNTFETNKKTFLGNY